MVVVKKKKILNIFSLCLVEQPLVRQLLVGQIGSLHYRGITITLKHTTIGRTSLDE
jgi:hypothetical protein